jgi:FkbM family methyltransferase
MRGFYSQFIGPDDTVFDIGANVGNRTRVFVELAKVVVAVEPQESCMGILQSEFQGNPKVRLVCKAVGAQEGEAKINICPASTISSMSKPWMEAVQKSGRFGGLRWTESQSVGVTTLDRLMQEFGYPSFIKVDVEGYELEVLKGLSKPPQALSYEFTPEYLDDALGCSERLHQIGMQNFNYSLGESMRLELPCWVSREMLAGYLGRYEDNVTFGDVYAKK